MKIYEDVVGMKLELVGSAEVRFIVVVVEGVVDVEEVVVSVVVLVVVRVVGLTVLTVLAVVVVVLALASVIVSVFPSVLVVAGCSFGLRSRMVSVALLPTGSVFEMRSLVVCGSSSSESSLTSFAFELSAVGFVTTGVVVGLITFLEL